MSAGASFDHYRDEGCAFWSACLACPFRRCLEEEPGGPAAAYRRARNATMGRLFAEGWPAPALAEAFGLTRRGVYHALHKDAAA